MEVINYQLQKQGQFWSLHEILNKVSETDLVFF